MKNLKIIFAIFIFIFTFFINAAQAAFKHGDFDEYLKRYVRNGHVKYSAMLKKRKPLDNYLKRAGNYPSKELRNEQRKDQIAFYINVYNAITIKRILDNYPPIYKSFFFKVENKVKSIKNIKGVWDKLKTKVAGRMLTLNEIEHEILRAKFKEPLIHFALVCASKGCPKLQSYAFDGKKLKVQLNECVHDFLNDPKKNKFCGGCKFTKLSEIFKWFGGDFIKKYATNGIMNKKYGKKIGSVLNFISKFINKKYSKQFYNKNHSVKFLKYDWRLNE